jgi:hypothetical protein
MQWSKMSPSQRGYARKLAEKLGEEGIGDATVSQIAKHFDEVAAWGSGEKTLEALLKTTGWASATPASPVDALRDAKDAKVAADEALRDALRAAKDAGMSANAIAAEVSGVVSRPVVLRLLGEESLWSAATRALRHFDLEAEVLLTKSEDRVKMELIGDADRASDLSNAAAIIEALRAANIGLTLHGGPRADMVSQIAACQEVELIDCRAEH